MKLLKPRELNDKLQEQKKSEIDSGLFLAKKIDRLREDLANAQKEHDDGIAGLKKEFVSFTNEYVDNKARLVKEIKAAEAKLAKLREPLDEEWKKAHEHTRQNAERNQSLNEKSIFLDSLKRELDGREEAVENAEISAQNTLSKAKEIEEKAVVNYQKAADMLATARSYENQAKGSIEVQTRILNKREANITEREVAHRKEVESFNKEKKILELKKKRWNQPA